MKNNLPKQARQKKEAQQRALKNRTKKNNDVSMDAGSYPKGDYRYGMPKKILNLPALKKKGIITSFD